MNRTIYAAARRAYRASCRVSLLAPGALEARIAARQALAAITGHWDDCTPARWTDSRALLWTKNRQHAVHSWKVYAACTRFLKSH